MKHAIPSKNLQFPWLCKKILKHWALPLKKRKEKEIKDSKARHLKSFAVVLVLGVFSSVLV